MEIMFIDQEALFATIGKNIRFIELIPIFNRTKEDRYKEFGVVMRHKNKTVFEVKHTECDNDFKSIIGEVCNEMRI